MLCNQICYSPDKNLRYGDDYCQRAKPLFFNIIIHLTIYYVCLCKTRPASGLAGDAAAPSVASLGEVTQWLLRTERWPGNSGGGLLTRNTFSSILMCRCYHRKGQPVKIASHAGISIAAIGKFACLLELGILKILGLGVPTLWVNTENSSFHSRR
jgi:hypothetical protein